MSKQLVACDPDLVASALRTFTNLAKAWSLTEAEQTAILGLPVHTASAAIEVGASSDRWTETLKRVSYMIGIYCALHILFPDPHQADEWIRRPNDASLFRGAPALELMCSNRQGDLASVREFLEGQGLSAP